MSTKKKFGCGPIGLLVVGLIVFGIISSDDDEDVPVQQVLSGSPSSTVGVLEPGTQIEPETRFVTADSLNVRMSPAADAAVIGKVNRGTALTTIRRYGTWYGVRGDDGSIGWLHGDYLATRRPATPSRLVGGSPAAQQGAGCHPSYVGKCLPIGPDLDCADIRGSVGVIGPDVYRLDRDRDGVGCE